MTKQLKPCPFCDSEALLIIDSYPSKGLETFRVICGYVNCGVRSSGKPYHNKQEAIEAWNRRVNYDTKN